MIDFAYLGQSTVVAIVIILVVRWLDSLLTRRQYRKTKRNVMRIMYEPVMPPIQAHDDSAEHTEGW